MNPNENFDIWQREQYRKSMDTMLVFNPTDEDYVVIWDKTQKFMIPNKNKDMGFGKGQMQLLRYIADKYMKEMKDKLINSKADAILHKTKIEREAKGLTVDPYEVNASVMNSLPRTNNEKEIEETYGVLYGGLVREFGLDETPAEVESLQIDQRTPEEKAMDKVAKAKEIPVASNSEVVEPDDLTTAPTNDYITDKGVSVYHIKESEPKKSRISSNNI